MSNLLTGHHEPLIWTTSRICGVRWKGQCTKPGLFSLSEISMPSGLLYQTHEMMLVSALRSICGWVHAERNAVSGWSTGVPDFLLKGRFLKTAVLRANALIPILYVCYTLEEKTHVSRLLRHLPVYSKLVKVAARGPRGLTTRFAKQTMNTAQTLSL